MTRKWKTRKDRVRQRYHYKVVPVSTSKMPGNALGGWHTERNGEKKIYVDKRYPKGAIRNAVIYHEKEEHKLMKDGMPYYKAHKIANAKERKKFGDKIFNKELGYTRAIVRDYGNN